MVKGMATVGIERKASKRRYLGGKHTYMYERLYVPIPKQFHDQIRPFLNRRLKITVKPANGGFQIICTPRENVSAPRKHPVKTASKLISNPHF